MLAVKYSKWPKPYRDEQLYCRIEILGVNINNVPALQQVGIVYCEY